MFSKVEIHWIPVTIPGDGVRYVVSQDTFIDISNDFPRDVSVQLYFVNGDGPLEAVYVGDSDELLERSHPGWNWVDCQIELTQDDPIYFSALTGEPAGCQPFTVLDPGSPPGRPDTDEIFGPLGRRVLRGFIYAWAVKTTGEEICWNHLTGDATIVNYTAAAAWEYNAWAAQGCPGVVGSEGRMPDATDSELSLDGVEYDIAPDKLLFDFYSSFGFAHSGDGCLVINDTDLTLHPVSQDLRQDNDGPIYTKAKFDIWNENEVRFSGTERCIVCWDQTLISEYDDPNHMLRKNLHTDKGKARIDGLGSTQCPLSVDTALLGVARKTLFFLCRETPAVTGAVEIDDTMQRVNFDIDLTGRTLVGQGEQAAQIQWDIIEGPSQASGR
jgi:hypothetical protein